MSRPRAGISVVAAAFGGLLLIDAGSVARPAEGFTQQQEPGRALQFGADVETVLIDLSVTDADGKFVHGLDAGDFRVFEEGEEMEITFFAMEKFAPEEMQVGVAEVDDAPSLNRYIVIYVDGINTTPQDWLRVRPHLRAWLESGLQPNDHVLLASLHPDRRMRMTPEFSRDAGVLVDALMNVEGNSELSFRLPRQERELAQALGLESGTDVAVDAARLRQGAQLASTYANQRRDEVRISLEYLVALADHLGVTFQVPGPKIVVMISGGLPEIPGLSFRLMVDQQASETSPQVRQLAGLSTFQPLIPERGADEGAQMDLLHAIGRFNRANYVFYTVDASALGGAAGGGALSGFETNLSPTARATAASNEQHGLLRIADGTGGLAFYNSDNFEAALVRAQRDTAFRYVLGYRLPTHDPEELSRGKFFRVRVETELDDVTIRAREGYVDGRR